MLQRCTTTSPRPDHLTCMPHTARTPFQDAMSRLNTGVSPDPAAKTSKDTTDLANNMLGHQPPKNWTYINFRPRAPRGTPADSMAITSGYGDGTTVSVHREDLPRLDKGQWLVTRLVDFHCYEVGNAFVEQSPWRYKDLCVLSANPWFSCSASNGKFANAARIDAGASPLDHKYVAFPMNARENHWVLGILTHASDLLVEHNPSDPIRTSLLVLNSIHGYNPRDLDKRYPDFIRLLAMGKKLRHGAVSKVKLFKPEVSKLLELRDRSIHLRASQVLQQPNGTDCGLYPGHFLSVFLTDPAQYEAICKVSLSGLEARSRL